MTPYPGTPAGTHLYLSIPCPRPPLPQHPRPAPTSTSAPRHASPYLRILVLASRFLPRYRPAPTLRAISPGCSAVYRPAPGQRTQAPLDPRPALEQDPGRSSSGAARRPHSPFHYKEGVLHGHGVCPAASPLRARWLLQLPPQAQGLSGGRRRGTRAGRRLGRGRVGVAGRRGPSSWRRPQRKPTLGRRLTPPQSLRHSQSYPHSFPCERACPRLSPSEPAHCALDPEEESGSWAGHA